MRWTIKGIDRSSGRARELEVSADTEQDARFLGLGAGIVVQEVAPRADASPSVIPYQRPRTIRVRSGYHFISDAWIWLAVLAAAVLRLVAGAGPAAYQLPESERFSFMLEAALLAVGVPFVAGAAIGFPVWRFLGRSRAATRFAFISTALIASLVLAGTSHYFAYQSRRSLARIRSVDAMYHQFHQEHEARRGKLDAVYKAQDAVKDAKTALQADLKQARIDYEQQYARLLGGAQTIADPMLYVDPKRRAALKRNLPELRKMTDTYHAQAKQLLAEFPSRIASQELSAEARQSALDQFLVEQQPETRWLDDDVELERGRYPDVEQLIAFVDECSDAQGRMEPSQHQQVLSHIENLSKVDRLRHQRRMQVYTEQNEYWQKRLDALKAGKRQ